MLTGYLERFSYRGGEAVPVRLSTDADAVTIEVVRLIHGDTNPEGPGFQSEFVGDVAPQVVPGQLQPTHPGSYMMATQVLEAVTEDLALSVTAWPTTPQLDGTQGLLSVVDDNGDTVLGLGLDRAGCPVVLGRGGVHVSLPQRLHEQRWYHLSVEATASGLTLAVEPLEPVAGERTQRVSADTLDLAGARDVMAAALGYGTEAARRVPCGLYNGKLERPAITSGGQVLADWAFEREMATGTAVDQSGRAADGTLVNSPTRAATGHQWDGTHLQPAQKPEHYAAIHFHVDDLIDAGWDVSAVVELPGSLPSGVYAVRLRTSEMPSPDSLPSPHVDHIPFAVRPPAGEASSDVVLLLPTFTYVAYANERLQHRLDYEQAGITDHPIEPGYHDRFLADHPEFGLSLYDHHSDGSGVCYSSHLRPVPNLRPDYRMWLQNAPRHLSADLYMVAALEEFGVPYDVLTDHDLHAEGVAAFGPYSVVITGSHPEYHSSQILDAFTEHADSGGHLMYLGANGFYWVTSASPERPEILEVRRSSGIRTWEVAPGEHHHSTTGEPGGLWRWRGRAPNKLVGIGMCSQGWDEKAPPYLRTEASYEEQYSWVFAGIEDKLIGDFGLIMNGASGDELDRFDPSLGSSPSTVVLASSTGHSDYYQLAVEDVLMLAPGLGGSECEDVRSDMVLLEHASGGCVFSTGSICFTGCLPVNDFDNNVARLVQNVLTEFRSRGKDA